MSQHNYTTGARTRIAAASPLDAAEGFFEALFAQAPDDELLGLSWKHHSGSGGFQSRQFPNTAQGRRSMAERAIELSDDGNHVWFCTATMTKVSNGRGTADDVRTVVAYCADVDLFDPSSSCPDVHKAGDENPTVDQAKTMLDRFGIVPNVVVDSGFGWHAYWLLSEPIGADEAEHDFLRETWAALKRLTGYAPDLNTGAINQLLRVPGTTNWKRPNEPRLVKIIRDRASTDGDRVPARVEPADIELACTALVSEWQVIEAAEDTVRAAEIAPDRAGKPHSATPAKNPPRRPDGRSVIDAFNETFTLETMLAEIGCKPGSPGRWSLPGSKGEEISTKTGVAKFFSVSAGGARFARVDKSRSFSSFGLLCAVRHGDDRTAALWDAAARLDAVEAKAALAGSAVAS